MAKEDGFYGFTGYNDDKTVVVELFKCQWYRDAMDGLKAFLKDNPAGNWNINYLGNGLLLVNASYPHTADLSEHELEELIWLEAAIRAGQASEVFINHVHVPQRLRDKLLSTAIERVKANAF